MFYLFLFQMTKTKAYIQQALKTPLPGAASHSKMLPPGRLLKAPPADKSRIKNSSVLLLLFEEEKQLKACLIKRPAHMKHHAGQIALPGGRMDGNETATETALRETHEEIGVESRNIEILGSLSQFYVEVSRFSIQPMVGWLKRSNGFTLNAAEVEKIIFFPLSCFKPPYQEIKLDTMTGKLSVPCIKYEGEIIWGATAMILSEFYDILKKHSLH